MYTVSIINSCRSHFSDFNWYTTQYWGLGDAQDVLDFDYLGHERRCEEGGESSKSVFVSHLFIVKLRVGSQDLLLLLSSHQQLVVTSAHVGVGLQ